MEQWKAIPGFDGIYEASNEGRIRSVDGKTTHNRIRGEVHWRQRIIKQHDSKRGRGKNSDARVTLWKNKNPHYFLVSRLIAATWCGGFRDGMTVNHIDGNPANNRACNLEWVSLKDNITDGFKNGLYPCTRVVLAANDGTEKTFYSMAEASRYLGRSHSYIHGMLKKGKTTTPDGYEVKVYA